MGSGRGAWGGNWHGEWAERSWVRGDQGEREGVWSRGGGGVEGNRRNNSLGASRSEVMSGPVSGQRPWGHGEWAWGMGMGKGGQWKG